jgi:ABC-type branched-subunit amino acid transport system substrate-binding protein
MSIVVASNQVNLTNYRGFASGFFFVCLLLLSSGCTGVDPVIKIGLVGPFVGKHRELGYDVIYSMRMAVREINEMGGIDGHRVALVALDDFGDPEMARENATALSADDAVVAVIGHWLPETTSSASEIYENDHLPFIAAGQEPFGPTDPAILPSEFRQSYSEVTPFDEVAGSFAGAGYDAIQLLFTAMELAADEYGGLERDQIASTLDGLTYRGITGQVFAPR